VLDVNVPVESYPTLEVGAHGLAVRVLQEKLGAQVDGAFGPKTESAVRQFQLTAGLPTTGIVDGTTWRALLGP